MKLNEKSMKNTHPWRRSLDHNVLFSYFCFIFSCFYKKTWTETTFPESTCQKTECTWVKLNVLGWIECSWRASNLRTLIFGHRQVDSVSAWVHLDSECSCRKSECTWQKMLCSPSGATCETWVQLPENWAQTPQSQFQQATELISEVLGYVLK